ncbi:MAG: polysaccharide biosynthesis C-terminal domain-containing protein [SAR202 cluster bacterium]|jgi:O-antigen/teichoic acid export membrane protein|nr:polysaccharide biosynthesis C-terminal domain-containing protein [SAR202 cluster bacterium]
MTEGTHRLATALRSFLTLGIGNYGAMAIGLAVNVLLARRLGTEQYGRLALMLMASQVLLLVAVNWSHVGFVRFGSREFASKGEITETLWTRLGMLLPTAGSGVLVIALARQPLAAYLGIPQAGVWLILVHFAAACALSLIGAVFQAGNQMARYGVCLFLDKAVLLLCVVALPAMWTDNPMAVLACYATSSLSVAIWGVSVVGARALRPVIVPRSAYRHMVLFSVPVLLSSWAGLFGANWFDLVILKWYVPLSGIGLYSLGTQLAGVVQQITVIFSTLLLPQLSVMVAEGQDERIRMLVERLLPYWLLGTSVLFSLVVLGARTGVPLVFGQSFSDAAPVLAVLMVATIALALFNSCAPLVTAYGSMWVMSGICFASAAANIVLDLVLIPRFGVLGSALATALAYGTSAVLVLSFVQRRIGGRVLRLGWLGAPVVVACVCFMLLEGFWFYPAVLVAVAITVLALVWMFRLFHNEDALFLRDLHLPMSFGLGAGSLFGRRP